MEMFSQPEKLTKDSFLGLLVPLLCLHGTVDVILEGDK